MNEDGRICFADENTYGVVLEINGHHKLELVTPRLMSGVTIIQPNEDGSYNEDLKGEAGRELFFSIYFRYHGAEYVEKIIAPMAEAGIPLAAAERMAYHKYLHDQKTTL